MLGAAVTQPAPWADVFLLANDTADHLAVQARDLEYLICPPAPASGLPQAWLSPPFPPPTEFHCLVTLSAAPTLVGTPTGSHESSPNCCDPTHSSHSPWRPKRKPDYITHLKSFTRIYAWDKIAWNYTHTQMKLHTHTKSLTWTRSVV